jgi:hypothetical protein
MLLRGFEEIVGVQKVARPVYGEADIQRTCVTSEVYVVVFCVRFDITV